MIGKDLFQNILEVCWIVLFYRRRFRNYLRHEIEILESDVLSRFWPKAILIKDLDEPVV